MRNRVLWAPQTRQNLGSTRECVNFNDGIKGALWGTRYTLLSGLQSAFEELLLLRYGELWPLTVTRRIVFDCRSGRDKEELFLKGVVLKSLRQRTLNINAFSVWTLSFRF